MATNHLGFDERLKKGKQNESRVLALLNEHRPVVCHTIWDKWIPSAQAEDMTQKIDAWAYSGINEQARSVQIKYRETGGDLGIAVIRPYIDFDNFYLDVQAGDVCFDRDFINSPDFYAVLSGTTLMVVEGHKVKKGVDLMMKQFLAHGGFKGHRGFKHANYKGAELRLVTDQGGGYSSGQDKIICYFEPSFIRMAGGFIKEIG